MNKVPKLVVSRTLTDASAWANSEIVDDPVEVIRHEERDVIITGSLSIVHPLIAAGLVDEYRLRSFPTLLGAGERLFPDGGPVAELECLTVEPVGHTVFARYGRPDGSRE
jgi:dihydrofolate reductase